MAAWRIVGSGTACSLLCRALEDLLCQLPHSRVSATASLLMIAASASKVKIGRGPLCDPVSSHSIDCLKSTPGSGPCTTGLPHVLKYRAFLPREGFLQITVSLAGHQQDCDFSGGAMLGEHWVGAGKRPSETHRAILSSPTGLQYGEEKRVASPREHTVCVAHGRAGRHH